MAPLTPEQRTLRAQVAAYARWGRPGARAKAKDALSRWERQVDPDGVLAPDERAACAESAMRAHMARMRLARSKAQAQAAAKS